MGIIFKFWHFYDARFSNTAMSRNSGSKFQKDFIFFLILHSILGTAAKFLVEKLSTSEVISQKPHGGGGVENTSPPVLLGLIIFVTVVTLYTFSSDWCWLSILTLISKLLFLSLSLYPWVLCLQFVQCDNNCYLYLYS